MEPDLACIDGQLMPLSQATIAVTDHGLIRGDGAFEVIRLYGRRPYALDAHLARLERSAMALRLAVDLAAVRADVEALLAAAAPSDMLVRVMVTRGGRRITLLEEPAPAPESVALVTVVYAPTRVLDGIKSLSYGANMQAARLAREQGGDDALLVSPHGRVLECPTASFFLVRDGELWTPPLTEHILDSITRRAVLRVANVREEPIARDELTGATEAFVASSGSEILGVHAIDGERYEAPGPRTREIAGLVRELVAAELD
jgi:branched-chain amino acid aminotransferase